MHTATRAWVLFALGLLAGATLGPTAAWAGERLELEWPDVFRIQADRRIPIEVDRPLEVRLDDYQLPTIKVSAERLPAVAVESLPAVTLRGQPPAVATLWDDGDAVVFVALDGSGQGSLYRVRKATAAVERLGRF